MSLSQQEFTNAGRAMLGRAQNGETLTFTQIVIGSGVATQPSDLWPLTQLIAQQMATDISTQRDYGNGTLLVEGSILSSDAPAAFQLREVGVLAHIANEADQLYSVSNVFADPPDTIDPAAPTVEVFKIKLVIDRIPSANVIVQIGPTEAVSGVNVGADTVGPGPYKDTQGNVLRFKRLVQGAGITLTDDPNENFIKIDATSQTFTADLDLYVPANYPGITDPNVLFPTIQAAHDHLLQYTIPAAFHARIHVYSGNFTQNTPINITHPNASQIEIIGLDVIVRTPTGNVTVAGTLPNLSVTVNLANTAGIAVGDVVYLWTAPHYQLEGCGVVSSIAANAHIVVAMRIANVMPPSSKPVGSMKLVIFPTQFASNTTGNVFNLATGIGLLKNFALKSTSAQHGTAVAILNNANLENIIVSGYDYGFAGTNGNANLTPIIAANACNVGLSAGPAGSFQLQGISSQSFNRVVISGCLIYGQWLVKGSYAGGNGAFTYLNSNNTGVRSDGGFFGHSYTSTSGGIVVGANVEGLHAEILGIILTSLQAQNSVQDNTTWDARAHHGGQVAIVHNTQTTGHYDPANKVLGDDGGYIDISSP